MTVTDDPRSLPFQARDSTPGMGSEAKDLARRFGRAHGHSTAYSNASRLIVKRALAEACERASVEGWAGPGTSAAEPMAILYSEDFIDSLPSGFPSPEFSIAPTGEIILEWDYGNRRVLLVSVDRDGVVSYAGRFGIEKGHAAVPFRGALPRPIGEWLLRVFPKR